MPGTTICGLADGAAWPIKNAVTKFRGEFEDYIRTHQSPEPWSHRLARCHLRRAKPTPTGRSPPTPDCR